jgi:DNA-binding winged helix-turn-helix (wHTH) protein
MPMFFGRFELDEGARALRLDGIEQPLQPLVFDLLVYLVTHRARVVSKDELLEKVWSGVAVTEGSLQRAVSLLRGALRSGGSANAVQTFARRGYRFCEELRNTGAGAPSTASSAEAWEAEGTAATCAGELEASITPYERALAAYDERGAHESAARVALLLCNIKLEAREIAVAKGWHRRALGYLAQLPECKEHGMAEWLSARLALFDGQLDECATRAQSAMAIARRVGDPDVQSLGLVYCGHVLIAQSHVRQGLSLHDEAGVAVLAGRVSTYAGGIVFCSVIMAYLHLGDLHRAGQWTDEFARWCERHPAYAFPALCRLHRGEVLAYRGELAIAQEEIDRARGSLAVSGPYTEGDACRVLGDIHLVRGELDAADGCFREAHRLGWTPQPGLAQLLAARGQPDAAIKQLERTLAQPAWNDGQRTRSILAVLARIAAMNGRLERARAALDELALLSESSITPSSAAETARARGELHWAEGDVQRAEPLLRLAVSEWLSAGARVHAAHVRLRLCEALLAAADTTAAELELSAAESVFREVGAKPVLEACASLRARLS